MKAENSANRKEKQLAPPAVKERDWPALIVTGRYVQAPSQVSRRVAALQRSSAG